MSEMTFQRRKYFYTRKECKKAIDFNHILVEDQDIRTARQCDMCHECGIILPASLASLSSESSQWEKTNNVMNVENLLSGIMLFRVIREFTLEKGFRSAVNVEIPLPVAVAIIVIESSHRRKTV